MLELITEPICMLLGLIYAPFMSFKALQTQETDDDKKWWVGVPGN